MIKKILWILEMPLNSLALDMQVWKINKLVSEGNSVDVVLCSVRVGACYVNPLGSKRICGFCKDLVKRTMLNISVNLIDLDKLSFNSNKYSPKNRLLAKENRNWHVDSTFISKFRIGVDHTESKMLKNAYLKLSNAYHVMFETVQFILKSGRYNELWTFNERTILAGAAIECAKSMDVSYVTFELVGRDYQVFIARNISIFSTQYFGNEFRGLMRTISRKEVLKGKEFYQLKLQGIRTNDVAYYVPAAIANDLTDIGKIDLLFLFSSEDEFESLGPYIQKYYDSQEAVCLFVKRHFTSLNIAVRFHPNQEGIPKAVIEKKISLLRKNGVRVFEPKSAISSYDLLTKAGTVVTFGSTIGLEAVNMRKRVIQVGSSMYSGMHIISQADSLQSLVAYLANPSTIVKKRFRAIACGYFLMNYSSEPCDRAYVTENSLDNQYKYLTWYGRLYCRIWHNAEFILSGRKLKLYSRLRSAAVRYIKR
jgi:hypothetical protein